MGAGSIIWVSIDSEANAGLCTTWYNKGAGYHVGRGVLTALPGRSIPEPKMSTKRSSVACSLRTA